MVITECSSLAAHWEQLSGYLGLSFELIDKIKGDHSTSNTGCWNEALKQWIKQNYKTERFGEPSWKNLLRAIARIDKLQFKILAAAHQVEGEHDINSEAIYTTLNVGLLHTATTTVSVQIHLIEKDTERSSPAASNVHKSNGQL